MSSNNQEGDRLSRIRDAQIQGRERAQIKGKNIESSSKKPQPKLPPLMWELFRVFPTHYQGAFFGILLGLGVTLFLAIQNPSLAGLGVGAMAVLAVIGWIIGKLLFDRAQKAKSRYTPRRSSRR
jgi:hypothetical protein